MKEQINRNYIRKLEQLNEGRINWEKWDEIVEITRKELEKIVSQTKVGKVIKQMNHYTKKVYGYNSNGDLTKVWNSKVECAKELNVSDSLVHNYSTKLAVVKETLLSATELKKDVAFAHYRFAIEHGLVYGWSSKKIGKPLYQYNEDGKLVAVWEKVRDWATANGYSSGTSYGGTFSEADRLHGGRLTSFNLYDEETAKEIFKEAKPIVIKMRKTYKNS